jgi:superfamily II DNA or RNA helicase
MQLTEQVVYNHLAGKSPNGSDVVGIYPLTTDDCCYFLAIDFDAHGADSGDWQADVRAFRAACAELGLQAAIERSRSGKGAHAWFFFDGKIEAATARDFGSGLLSYAMQRNSALSFDCYDRMFPNQDNVPKGGFGNLIALPLQGFARKDGNSLFVDEEFRPYLQQWDYLGSLPRYSLLQVQDIIWRIGAGLGHLAYNEEEEAATPWQRKREPAPLTPEDFPPLLEVTRANGLYVPREGLSERAIDRIKRLAAFPNPEFQKAQALRLPIWNIQRVISCADFTAKHLVLPRGCEENLAALLRSAGTAYAVSDRRNPGQSLKASFNAELWPEQVPAAQAILAEDYSVLSATTAFGKTVVASYIIAQRKVNTLILVHTNALMEQWKKALSFFLTIDEPLPEEPAPEEGKKPKKRARLSHIGQKGGGKDTALGFVDIAIMQSLTHGDEVDPMVRDYGMVICDECHHISAVSFERIMKAANPTYTVGLSATPKRRDGLQPIIFMQCGPIRYTVDAIEQARRQGIGRFILLRETAFIQPALPDGGKQNVSILHDRILHDEARNRQIVKDVLYSLSKGRSCIVLTKLVEHAQVLAAYISAESENVIVLTGKGAAKPKREALERVKSIPPEERLCIVATGSYIGEGFDEPRLDTLFLAAPVAWQGTLQQYCGRLHREYPGKENVFVFDYQDTGSPILMAMFRKRLQGYEDMGYSMR